MLKGENKMNVSDFVDILNDQKYSELAKEFRENKINYYAATEIAYIYRYLAGEKELIPGKDFSIENLKIIKKLNSETGLVPVLG
jgi:hypothetical protein